VSGSFLRELRSACDYDGSPSFGVDVKGKIVISRYGGSWLGISQVAAETAPSAA